MSKYAKHVSTRVTPQSMPIPGSAQVPNSAGGFAFAVDRWKRLERFLILGNEGGSYYASERTLTIENAACVRECLAEDAARTMRTIVEISDQGRAPKNDPAVFALAIAAGSGHTTLAMEALPRVCRIGTHLFQFAEAVEHFRGWGRGLRKGIAAWYAEKPADELAFQVVKYQQRNAWSHRDLLRLSHASGDAAHQAIYRWVVAGSGMLGERAVVRGQGEKAQTATYAAVGETLPRIIQAFDEAKKADRATVIRLIREEDLPRECVPTEHLNAPEVWDALLVRMPLTAMLRNLAKMTSIGLIAPFSQATQTVVARLADADYLRKSRLHPMAILLAASVYSSGKGQKGSLSWTPVSAINDALDAAFYKAFPNVEPANKRTMLALDVSGSMAGSLLAGTQLSARDASAAMALVTARTEPSYQIMAFSQGFVPLDISACSKLSDVVARTSSLPFEGTDCAQPMLHAEKHGLSIETFVVYTDSETWAGSIHPVQALERYRQKTGLPAKLIVVGMVSNGFTIADPSDAGMLDVVGFDASVPAVMADFSRS